MEPREAPKEMSTSDKVQHNMGLAIHSLAPEVFSQIISHAIDNSGKWEILTPSASNFMKNYTLRLHDLASVATYWYRVISSTPTLWTLVEQSDASYWVALKHSRRAPLTLRARLVRSTEKETKFLARCLEHRERWQSLDVHGIGAATTMLNHELLALMTLRVNLPRMLGQALEWPRAPRLRTLSILGLRSVSGFRGYPMMRHLTLVGCYMSTEAFYSAVVASPLLEEMHMTANGLVGPGGIDIQLDNLHRLTISTAHPMHRAKSLEIDLVGRLSAPRLEHFSVTFEATKITPRKTVSELLAQFLTGCNGHRLHCTTLSNVTSAKAYCHVTVVQDQIAVVVEVGSEEKLVFKTSIGEKDEQLAVVNSLFGSHSALPVHLVVLDENGTLHLTELSCFPTLDELHFLGNKLDPCLAVIQWLGKQQEDGSWPCPNLYKLRAPFRTLRRQDIPTAALSALRGLESRMRSLPIKLQDAYQRDMDFDETIHGPSEASIGFNFIFTNAP